MVKKESTPTTKAKAHVKGLWCSCTSIQAQMILDLGIEKGMSARKGGLTIGVIIRIAQHCVKLYKDDEEKSLLLNKRLSCLDESNAKLKGKYTDFLCSFYNEDTATFL